MIRRGQIYFVDLNPTEGREQSGRRPVVVVSSDEINRLPLVATVVIGTTGNQLPKPYPTNVHVSAEESGLPKDTVFLCFQIRALDHSRLGHPAGSLPAAKMDEISRAIRLVLDLG